MTSRNRKVVLNHITVEFLILNACILLAAYIIFPSTSTIRVDATELFQMMLILNLGWIAIIMLNGNSAFYFHNSFSKRSRYFILNVFLLVGLTYTVGKIVGVRYFDKPIILLPIFLFATFNLLFFQSIFKFLDTRSRSGSQSRALVISKSNNQSSVSSFTESIENSGYRVIKYIIDEEKEENTSTEENIKIATANISRIHEVTPVDEIFIDMESFSDEELKETVSTADYLGVRLTMIPSNTYVNTANARDITEMPLLKVRSSPLDELNNYFLKMVFDFLFAFTCLILLSPILILISLIILADGKGGVFYMPHRKGLDGKTFKCFKFRSMKQNDDPVAGKKSTVKNDPRITRIGKFMRKFDIDELPQLINVLKGEMSIVGPRPHRVFLQQNFREVVSNYMVRHYVKPGLTGWAQVNGWRGPTVSDEQKIQRIKHDIYYIENWSLWFDIRIIFLTVFGKKTRQNAF